MTNAKIFPQKFLILHKALQNHFNEALKDEEIAGSDAKYFLLLSNESLTQAELTERCKHDKARINRVVTSLQEKGFVEYQNNESLKNKKIVLTQKGRACAEKCKKIFEEYIKNLVAGIDKKELEITFNVLNKLIDNASNMHKNWRKDNA